MNIFKIIAASLMILMTSAVTAQTLQVDWTSPVQRTDNTDLTLTDIATFRVSYGTAAGVYSTTVDVNDSNATGTSIEFLPGGTYYVTITVIDTGGRLSVLAPEQSIVLDTAPPKPVTGLTLTAPVSPTP